MDGKPYGTEPTTARYLLAQARGNRNVVAAFAALLLAAFLVGGWLMMLLPLLAWRIGHEVMHRTSGRRTASSLRSAPGG